TAQLITLMATMLAIQATIGVLNDWADRALDAREKPWKPVPAGLVSPRAALATAVTFATLAVFLAALAGPVPWMLAMAGLACGIAYDLGLKRTPFSALTYAVALPLVPLWVWTALGQATPALVAVLPAGVLLGVALQLANALPDAAGDEAAGVRGTLQWLGPARGRRVAWLAFAGALALALLLAPIVGLRSLPFTACWLIAALLLVVAVGLYRRDPSRQSMQRGWTLLAPATGLLAVGWFASLP
ncbi:MAG: UbiA family prenyltransferase, partial [Dehalococcoidia bacterium]